VPPTITPASQTFGRRGGPVVYGWNFTAHQLGAAGVASAAGIIRTFTGNYTLAFVGSGLFCLLAARVCLFMRRPGEADTATPLPPDAPLLLPAAGAARR
jgi:hypothetical protein